MIVKCSICGKDIERDSWHVYKHNYCSTACRNASKTRRNVSLDGIDPENICFDKNGKPVCIRTQIVVTKLPGVFPWLMPQEGREYPAKLYIPRGRGDPTLTIESGGKEIILRPDEYKEVRPCSDPTPTRIDENARQRTRIAKNAYNRMYREMAQKMRGRNEKLLAWRAANNLTQAEAAVIFGVTKPTISNWETGAVETPEAVRRFIEKAACGAGTPQTAQNND